MKLSVVLAASVFILSHPTVHGHGYSDSPRSSTRLANLAGTDSSPHGKNGGSKGTVMGNTPGNGHWPWPYVDAIEDARHGICGEDAGIPVADRRYESFGEIISQNSYPSGGVMDVKVDITAHHKGHLEFRLCEVMGWTNDTHLIFADTVNYVCLNEHILLRTDTEGAMAGTDKFGPGYWTDYGGVNSENYPNAKHSCPPLVPLGDNAAERAQFDDCWPERYYLGVRRNTPKNPDRQGWSLQYKLKLPDNLTCKHCTLQMVCYYALLCLLMTVPLFKVVLTSVIVNTRTVVCDLKQLLSTRVPSWHSRHDKPE